MYSLNNIPLSDYGITPGRINGSSLAIAGMLNMPERIGKTFHDWTGLKGVQPYVLASEIKHGGRAIQFKGLIKADDKLGVIEKIRSFNQTLDSSRDLVNFDTPYGSHQVYVKSRVETLYLAEGWGSIQFEVQEPVVPNDGILPVGTVTNRPNIDGVALDSLGMFLTASKNSLNRPQIKRQEFTSYEKEGFQITPTESNELEFSLIAYATSYAQLQANIKSLHRLLAAPGMRKVNLDGSLWELFNIKGFSVRDVKLASDYAICEIKLPLMAGWDTEPLEEVPLLVNEYDNLVSNLNELIKVNNG